MNDSHEKMNPPHTPFACIKHMKQGAAIRVDGGTLLINQTLFYNNTDWSVRA